MTTVTELNKKLNLQDNGGIPKKISDKVDIGDLNFTDVKKLDEYSLEYTDKNNPNMKLHFYEDRATFNLYELLPDDKIKVTTWRTGNKMSKIFNKDDFKGIF